MEDRRQLVINAAVSYNGTPYALPPDGVNTLDCSLYVLKAFGRAGFPFPKGIRTAEQIRQACPEVVDWPSVKKGDLLFFTHTYEPDEEPGPDGEVASHIGISLGAGTKLMWDCHEPMGVQSTSLAIDYWQDHLLEARRPPQFLISEVKPPPVEPSPVEKGEAWDGLPFTGPYRVTGLGVRLRSLPGLNGKVLRGLRLAEKVLPVMALDLTIKADRIEWRQVQTEDGDIGWVATNYLEEI